LQNETILNIEPNLYFISNESQNFQEWGFCIDEWIEEKDTDSDKFR
jgi:hypothetical protein